MHVNSARAIPPVGYQRCMCRHRCRNWVVGMNPNDVLCDACNRDRCPCERCDGQLCESDNHEFGFIDQKDGRDPSFPHMRCDPNLHSEHHHKYYPEEESTDRNQRNWPTGTRNRRHIPTVDGKTCDCCFTAQPYAADVRRCGRYGCSHVACTRQCGRRNSEGVWVCKRLTDDYRSRCECNGVVGSAGSSERDPRDDWGDEDPDVPPTNANPDLPLRRWGDP